MNFQEILFSTIGTILTGLLAWLISIITSWISTKIKDNNAAKMITTILTIVTDAVQATYQTYVEALKGTNAWTKEAQEKALNMALNTIKKQLTQESAKFITENYGNIEEYLKTVIDSVLYTLKKYAPP